MNITPGVILRDFCDVADRPPAEKPQYALGPMRKLDLQAAPDQQTQTIRRWDAASTDRLNEAHWAGATGNPINIDLSGDLPALWARCDHEAYTNPMVEGVIETYGLDLIGPTGPTLQVHSDDERYNAALKQIWADWFALPTTEADQSGLDWLRDTCNWQLWTRGDILAQIVADEFAATSEDAVPYKLIPFDGRRLQTPWDAYGDPTVTLGVRRNKLGRATEYNIIELIYPYSLWYLPTYKANWIPAEDILHAFIKREPGQVRGYPWLASGLQEIADLRDYDTQVMDTARAGADTGVYFETTVPEACSEFKLQGGATPMGRRQERVVPPGYVAKQITPQQPMAIYKEFRHEKLRALGRPVHMPLLLVLLSAEESNFSQSRIDVNVFYERGLMVRRGWMEGRVLNRLVDMVARVATLAKSRGRFVLPPRPDRVQYHWVWDPLPQADPEKFASYVVLGLTWGWLTYDDVCAMFGRDSNQMMKLRADVNKRLVSAGLKPIPGPEAKVATGQKGATATTSFETGTTGEAGGEQPPKSSGKKGVPVNA